MTMHMRSALILGVTILFVFLIAGREAQSTEKNQNFEEFEEVNSEGEIVAVEALHDGTLGDTDSSLNDDRDPGASAQLLRVHEDLEDQEGGDHTRADTEVKLLRVHDHDEPETEVKDHEHQERILRVHEEEEGKDHARYTKVSWAEASFTEKVSFSIESANEIAENFINDLARLAWA